MKKVLIFLMVLIILGVGGYFLYNYYFYDEYEVPKDVIIELNDNNFIVYEEHNSNELVKSINADIISNDVKLENETIGEYKYVLKYKYKKKKYKYDITYQVMDTIEPVFIGAPKTLTMESSDEAEVCSKIVYADNYDNLPKCTINGEYDKTKIGTYNNLEYVITDNSGNEAKKALDELSKTNDVQDVYKTAGPLLIKTTKDETETELKDNIEMLEIRQKTIEKQEKRITSRLEELQTSLQTAMNQMQQ